jgi:hypothetical protein
VTGVVYPTLSVADRARFRQLQALEDAIAYRRARLSAACSACGPRLCDDHATDAALITGYRHAARHLGMASVTKAPASASQG